MTTMLDFNLKQAMHFLSEKDRWNVLTVLILHTDDFNRCWPSTNTLAYMGAHGNRKRALDAKKWLGEHGAFQLVPYQKRTDEEKKLPQRQHIYQLTGYIQACHDLLCDCGGDGRRYLYLRPRPQAKSFEPKSFDAESFDAESFTIESFDAETFNGETLSISLSSPSLSSQSSESLSLRSNEKRVGVLLAQITGANIHFSRKEFPNRKALLLEALNNYSYSTIRQAIRDSENEGARSWIYVANKLEAQSPIVLTGEDYITGKYADYIDH